MCYPGRRVPHRRRGRAARRPRGRRAGADPVLDVGAQFEYWKHTHLTIDVVPGRGSGFSVEAPEGVRFLIRSRLFTDEEYLPPRGADCYRSDHDASTPALRARRPPRVGSDCPTAPCPRRSGRGPFPFTRRTLPAFRALLLMERRAAVREASVTTGGRRGRTVAVLVGIVAVAGALLAGHAAAEPRSPAALRAHAEPLADGTPCSVSARSCVDLESQHAWLIDGGKVVRGPVGRSPRVVPVRRRRSGTRCGSTARSASTRAESSGSRTASRRRCRGRCSSRTAGSPSTPAIPPEPRQVASTYRKPTRRRGSSSCRSATRSRS